MGWFNFKKKAPNWNDLSEKQRQMVTQRIAKGINAMFYGPKYKLVTPTDEFQRERGLAFFFPTPIGTLLRVTFCPLMPCEAAMANACAVASRASCGSLLFQE